MLQLNIVKILVVDDEEMIRELITVGLETHFSQCEFLEADSGTAAIEAIKKHPDLDCIVCDYRMDNGTGGDVFQFLKSSKKEIPYILCSAEQPETKPDLKGEKLDGFIEKPFTMKSFLAVIDKVIQPDTSAEKPKMNYIRIRVKTLKALNALPCDLYVKLSETKYVKIMRESDSFGEFDSDRYEEKKISYLYIRTKDIATFLDNLMQGIASLDELSLFARSPSAIRDMAETISNESIKETLVELSQALEKTLEGYIDISESYEVSQSAQQIVHTATQRFGYNKEVQALTKANVSYALETIEQNPKLGNTVQKLLIEKDSYISSHSVVLAYISCGIASTMSWTSDLSRYKLTLASFLHDITLKNHYLAMNQTLSDLTIASENFSAEEQAAFENHTVNAANLISGIPEIPPGVEEIILQHHERPDGTGFPMQLDYKKINPLSAVFIIAHDIVSYIVAQKQETWTLKEYLEQAHVSDWKGHFKSIVDKLKTIEEPSVIKTLTLGAGSQN